MSAQTVGRTVTPRGELVLRRAGGHYEIVSNGTFLMDTRDGRSERLLVDAAVEWADAPRPRVLVGGLGVGFSLAAAVAHPAVAAVTVVEVEPAVIAWQRGPLAPFSGHAARDPRVEIVRADLVAWIARAGPAYDVICLDIDNGPAWTVVADNAGLYAGAGLAALRGRLAPGGVLAVWSASAEPAFEDRLCGLFAEVMVRTVAVARGEPDVVYVAR
ncbi:MAG TPA: spermidine synthase [Streptosporangiaceae bacterium]|jgi:spermidine synthase